MASPPRTAHRTGQSFHEHRLIDSTSLCRPAGRMVVLVAGLDPDTGEPTHEVHPVAAIRSTASRHYVRWGPPGETPKGYGSHEELVVAGWEFDECRVEEVSLVVLEGQICPASDLEGFASRAATVCCPWGREEDEARLSEALAGLREGLASRPPGSADE